MEDFGLVPLEPARFTASGRLEAGRRAISAAFEDRAAFLGSELFPTNRSTQRITGTRMGKSKGAVSSLGFPD